MSAHHSTTSYPPARPEERIPRVLVVEDSAEVRRAVERNLRGARMEVEAVACADEALSRALGRRPDLVLTDVNMPGSLDGFGLLRALRDDPRTSSVAVVMMTGVDDRASVRRGMRLGADDYLTKPFTGRELRETVQARLEHHARIGEAYMRRLQKTQAALFQATHHDLETGLPNRTAFRSHLEAAELGPSPLALVVVELDRLDRLVSAYHTTRPDLADQVIGEVARRIQRFVGGDGDVFRLGAYRFAVMDAAPPDPDVALKRTEALLTEVRQPISDGDVELRVTGSAGVAMWHREGGDASPFEVAARAEAASFHARESGGNCVAIYESALHDRALNRIVLESSLHRALEREQLELHYQPQVSARTGALIGVEALIRWRHPELGMVSPFHFIPIAEETGLIIEIGRWVLEEACRQTASWRDALPDLRVAVNLSALQLREDALVPMVLGILEETGLPATQLKLELTETMMVQAGDRAASALRTLRSAGVGVSIDDFGTGYSSLKNLRSFPIGEVKIDRSFVRHVPADRDNCSIVHAVIEMAHQLGLRVIAEGVEEQPQLDFLRQHGCDDIQGYFFSKPLPPAELLAWAQGQRAAA